ncbi:MAG: hypothetical protein JXR76_13730 [Deltaproteobacteria bacterium]|nr:hypothetical protein [Deltaproteobacteria bacterium]
MFQQQEIDVSWTNNVEQAATRLFNEQQFEGTEINFVECRTSLCKVEFRHDAMNSHETFVRGNMDPGPWVRDSGDAMGSVREDPDGTIRSFVYFSNVGDVDTFHEMQVKMADMITSNAS